jgi:hypothetical protein
MIPINPSIHLKPQSDGHKSPKTCPPATASLLLECGVAPENMDADWVDILEMVDVVHTKSTKSKLGGTHCSC